MIYKLDLDLLDPALMAEGERVLSGRIRDIWLTGPLLDLYRVVSWRQRSAIVRAWMVWVGTLSVIISVLVMPGVGISNAVVTAVVIGAMNLAVIRIWRRPRSAAVEGVSVVVANLGLFVLFSAMGFLAGGYDHERFATGGILVVVVAAFVLGIEWRFTVAMVVLTGLVYTVDQMLNPVASLMQGLAISLFYGSGLYGSVIARRTAIVLSQRTFLMTLRDVRRSQALAKANERLEELATTDPLTGLANRRSATERIGRVFAEEAVDGRGIAFVMADIDHFKGLNDTRGHAAGDECIRSVAEAIRGCVREGRDVVSRHGGEEFLVLLTRVTLDEAMATAERMRVAVCGLGIANPGAAPLGLVTISLGVAVAEAADGAEAVVTRADDALYEAKRAGRNRVEYLAAVAGPVVAADQPGTPDDAVPLSA